MANTSAYRPGDVDGNGVVDSQDASIVLSYVNQLRETNTQDAIKTEQGIKAGDIFNTGIVDYNTAHAIQEWFGRVQTSQRSDVVGFEDFLLSME